MAEKESLMAQYESIAEQTAVIEQVQKPLLQELNEVKKKVEEFDGQRQEAQVRARVPSLLIFFNTLIPRLQGRVTQAAEQRLAAQNEQHHWAKKLLDEEKKVRATKEQLDVVQQEFEVGWVCTLSGNFSRSWLLGLDKRSRAVLCSRP